ncbi:MAG: YfcE family phosphodiesterase [Planctomycetota bacterium]|nr:YfcE family phosphodiesterase [Planctomycetota bacterium]
MARKKRPKTIALLSDVHGNLPSLEAVLEDAAHHGAAEIWNLGDMLGYGPFPNEVLGRLREVAKVNIVGNYDRKVLDFSRKRDKWKRKKPPAKYTAFQWNDAHLDAAGRDFLGSLPEQARRTVGGLEVLLVHGSPASIDELLNSDTSRQRFSELARFAQADVVVCGHSHDPFVRHIDDVWFVNPGSVGRPEAGDWRASYALLEFSGENLKVGHRRVPYDIDRVARAVHAAGLPGEFIDVFRKGRSLDQLQDDVSAGTGWDDKRLEAVLALATDCQYEREHTHQVTRLALEMFDALKEIHQMGSEERFRLHCAALLHDIGWVEGPQGHHKTAMKLIVSDPRLPFRRSERQMIALIARYHRKALPDVRHKYYGNLSDAEQYCVRVLAGILRVADGLDRSHNRIVRGIACQASDRKIVMTCDVRGPADAELAAAAKKADLFREAFGRPLELKVTSKQG